MTLEKHLNSAESLKTQFSDISSTTTLQQTTEKKLRAAVHSINLFTQNIKYLR